jgi:hypothetical protein
VPSVPILEPAGFGPAPLTGWGNPDTDDQLYPLNKGSYGFKNALVVKTGPGILYGFTAYSSRGTAQFLQVFDLTAVPASGANPEFVIAVAAASDKGVNWLPGRTFRAGIVLVNSTTADTYTAGAADTYFDAQYL